MITAKSGVNSPRSWFFVLKCLPVYVNSPTFGRIK